MFHDNISSNRCVRQALGLWCQGGAQEPGSHPVCGKQFLGPDISSHFILHRYDNQPTSCKFVVINNSLLGWAHPCVSLLMIQLQKVCLIAELRLQCVARPVKCWQGTFNQQHIHCRHVSVGLIEPLSAHCKQMCSNTTFRSQKHIKVSVLQATGQHHHLLLQ